LIILETNERHQGGQRPKKLSPLSATALGTVRSVHCVVNAFEPLSRSELFVADWEVRGQILAKYPHGREVASAHSPTKVHDPFIGRAEILWMRGLPTLVARRRTRREEDRNADVRPTLPPDHAVSHNPTRYSGWSTTAVA
jgi:hypothetical protein